MDALPRLAAVDGAAAALGLQQHSALVHLALFGLLALILLRVLSSMFGKATGSKAAADAVLLVGPSGGGKTVLFHRLVHDMVPETLPSMEPNEGRVGGGPTAPLLVDFPGHRRMRSQLPAYLQRAKGIVLVVDASDFLAQLRETAEIIYDLFTSADFIDRAPPILVACAKSDLKAKSVKFIRSKLETELQALRATRSSMEATGDNEEEESDAVPLGREGRAFQFDVDSPCELSFTATSAAAADDEGVEAVAAFAEGL